MTHVEVIGGVPVMKFITACEEEVVVRSLDAVVTVSSRQPEA